MASESEQSYTCDQPDYKSHPPIRLLPTSPSRLLSPSPPLILSLSVSLFSQQICASVIFDICIDPLTGRGFLKVASRQPKCAVQEKVLLAYRVLRRPIHIILKQLGSRTSIPVSHCSVQENG